MAWGVANAGTEVGRAGEWPLSTGEGVDSVAAEATWQ